jgi:glycerol-3-phosphate dehydrogenase
MARQDAAKAIDLMCHKLGVRTPRAATDRLPIDGGDFSNFEELLRQLKTSAPAEMSRDVIEALAHNYGTRFVRILSLLRENPALGARLGESTTLRAEVVNAIRDEMAMRLADIVFRRTDLATGAHPGRRALVEAAAVAAEELNWDPVRQAAEISEVEQRFVPGNEFIA